MDKEGSTGESGGVGRRWAGKWQVEGDIGGEEKGSGVDAKRGLHRGKGEGRRGVTGGEG